MLSPLGLAAAVPFAITVTACNNISALDDAGAPDVDARPASDIAERLAAIEGMRVTGSMTYQDEQHFVLRYTQPVDHDRPGGATFEQLITLIHVGEERPMVMMTGGYDNYWRFFKTEVTELLNANQIAIEHRFYGDSVPDPADWETLTVRQAARDHHRIVEALSPLYRAPWVSTGYSKGGRTAVFHRRFFPRDVVGTVSFVAPMMFAIGDKQFADVLDKPGPASCRQALVDVQLESLRRRSKLMPLLESFIEAANETYDIMSPRGAYEEAVSSIRWMFWQYYGAEYCNSIPGVDASDAEIFAFIVEVGTLMDDKSIRRLMPYYYQSMSELGTPYARSEHLKGKLQHSVDMRQLMPTGIVPDYDDANAMHDVEHWMQDQGAGFILVYGGADPWTAGAIQLGNAEDAVSMTVADETHGAALWQTTPEEYQHAMQMLARWTGTEPKPVRSTAAGSFDFRPPGRMPAIIHR